MNSLFGWFQRHRQTILQGCYGYLLIVIGLICIRGAVATSDLVQRYFFLVCLVGVIYCAINTRKVFTKDSQSRSIRLPDKRRLLKMKHELLVTVESMHNKGVNRSIEAVDTDGRRFYLSIYVDRSGRLDVLWTQLDSRQERRRASQCASVYTYVFFRNQAIPVLINKTETLTGGGILMNETIVVSLNEKLVLASSRDLEGLFYLLCRINNKEVRISRDITR